jgi:hypothetical protein
MREFMNIKSVWVGANSGSQRGADTATKNE